MFVFARIFMFIHPAAQRGATKQNHDGLHSKGTIYIYIYIVIDIDIDMNMDMDIDMDFASFCYFLLVSITFWAVLLLHSCSS